MSETKVLDKISQTDITSFIAWGSVSYAFGFVTVMLYTSRLGFPILELISAVYVWIGAPLAIVAFFFVQIARFFRSKSNELAGEIKDSWRNFREDVAEKDLDVFSEFIGFISVLIPFGSIIRKPMQRLFEKAKEESKISNNRAAKFLRRFASLLRGIQAFYGFLRLFNTALLIILGIYLYVWVFYPLIPQSFGGGAPNTVRLLINIEKVPPGTPGIPDIKEDKTKGQNSKTVLTGKVDLIYSTKDQYYIQGAQGLRLSLSRSAIEGIIWNPKK